MVYDLFENQLLTPKKKKEEIAFIKRFMKLTKQEIINGDLRKIAPDEEIESMIRKLRWKNLITSKDFEDFKRRYYWFMKKEEETNLEKMRKTIRSLKEVQYDVDYSFLLKIYSFFRVIRILPEGMFFRLFEEIRRELNDGRWWWPIIRASFKKPPLIDKRLELRLSKQMKQMMKKFFLLQKESEELLDEAQSVENKRKLRALNYEMNYVLFKSGNVWRKEVERLSNKGRQEKLLEWKKEISELVRSNVWLVYEYYKAKGLLNTKEARIVEKELEKYEWRFNELWTKIDWAKRLLERYKKLLERYGEGCDVKEYASYLREKMKTKLMEEKTIIDLEKKLSLRDLELRELALKTLRICNERENKENYELFSYPNVRKHVKSCERRANKAVKHLLEQIKDVNKIKSLLTREEWSHPEEGLRNYINEYLRTGRIKFHKGYIVY